MAAKTRNVAHPVRHLVVFYFVRVLVYLLLMATDAM